MIKPLLFLLVFAQTVMAQKVYIDASAPEGGNGSMNNPYNSVEDILPLEANTTYYFNRGENYKITNTIIIEADNVTFDVYGNGERPRIWTDIENIRLLRTDHEAYNPQVRNLFFENTFSPVDEKHNMKNIIDFIKCVKGIAYNVKTKGGMKGICSYHNTDTLRIINCEISHTADDGSWFHSADVVYIDGLYSHDVNTDYRFQQNQSAAGGDNVQFITEHYKTGSIGIEKLIIVNSILDHTAYPLKFNIMVGSKKPEADWPSVEVHNCILMHNGEGSNIYTDEVHAVTIDKNILTGSYNAVYKGYNFGTDYVITRNVIYNHSNNTFKLQTNSSVAPSRSVKIYNNTIYNEATVFRLYNMPSEIKNNILSNVSEKAFYEGLGHSNYNNYDDDYNLYYEVNNNVPNEVHKIIGDPVFQNITNHNFHLQDGSHAIDNGVSISPLPGLNVSEDRDGTLAPLHGGWDIGAYEYNGFNTKYCTIYYSDFTNSEALVLNGNASINGNELALTNNTKFNASSVYDTTRVEINKFESEFTFNVQGDQRADGFTFILQNNSLNALGKNGGDLGYRTIDQSFAIKFDFWGGNRIAVYNNGEDPEGGEITVSPIDFKNGNSIKVWLGYDGNALDVSLKDLALGDSVNFHFDNIDIPGLIGSNTAWAGFTGGTGGYTSQINIESFAFTSEQISLKSKSTPEVRLSNGIDNLKKTSIKTYPNPTSGPLKLQINNWKNIDEKVNVEIYNISGLLIRKFNIQIYSNLSAYDLDLSDLQKGIYYLRIPGSSVNPVQLVKE